MKKSLHYTMALRMLEETNPYGTPVSELHYSQSYSNCPKEEFSLCNIVNRRLADAGEANRVSLSMRDKRRLCFKAIAEAMAEYLEPFPASFSYKQKTRAVFYQWLMEIQKRYDIVAAEEVIPDDLDPRKCPSEQDTAVAMVKRLQNRGGVSREDLAIELGITPRAVQKNLRKLDRNLYEGTKLDENASYVPFRIGGQPVHVRITSKEREKNRKYYRTVNTMHPIVLQENVLQVATLLQALFRNTCETESEISRFIAIDIWFQLTDYAKRKVRTYFDFEIDHYPFSEFLDELEAVVPDGGTAGGFLTEREMIRDARFDSMSTDETLRMVMKAGRLCNIEIERPGEPRKELRHQRIRQHAAGFSDQLIAVGEEGEEESFRMEDIQNIELLSEIHRT